MSSSNELFSKYFVALVKESIGFFLYWGQSKNHGRTWIFCNVKQIPFELNGAITGVVANDNTFGLNQYECVAPFCLQTGRCAGQYCYIDGVVKQSELSSDFEMAY
jgi:hypothetical protein